MAVLVPDYPIPGRYQVVAWVGKRREEIHRWANRHDAQRNAEAMLEHGYSDRWASRYTKVQVDDRINRTTIFEDSRAVKRYGR